MYIRSCREIAEQGLYVELGAYKCHTFLDWMFVDGERWREINLALNGAGIPSMQAKWDEMFGVKEEVKSEKEEEKSVKRKTKKAAATLSPKGKKPAAKKPAEKKSASKKATKTKTRRG
jgi:hypothetical protein